MHTTETSKSTDSALLKKSPSILYRWLGDKIFTVVVVTLGASVILLAAGMAIVLFDEGSQAIQHFGFWNFVTGRSWDPSVALNFGALPFLFGTMVTSVMALLISFLPAIAVAIFIAEYAPKWLGNIIDNLVQLIAAVPSVVIGIWGIFVLAPWLRDSVYTPVVDWAAVSYPSLLPILGNPMGYGVATATIVLALMIVPYTTALTKDAIRSVPREQREACRALGATRWEVIRMAVLPYARSGIIAGAILSFGRAIGETMAVAMLIGNKNSLPFSIFGAGATMPSVIVNEFREAVESLHLSSLMAIGFTLFIIAIIVNLLAAYVTRKLSVTGGQTI